MSVGSRMICSCLIGALMVGLSGAATAAERATTATRTRAGIRAKVPPIGRPLRLTRQTAPELTKVTQLTSDVVRLALDYIHQYKPRLSRQLDDLLKNDPKTFRLRVAEVLPYARQLEAIKDPQARARRVEYLTLEAQAEQAAIRYQEAPPEARPQIEAEVKALVEKLFQMKLDDERAQLEATRKNLEERQSALDQRTKSKDRIVDRELTRMLGIDETFAW